MEEQNSNKSKMSKGRCMQILVSTMDRNMKFKILGYKDNSEDLIFEATHSEIHESDNTLRFSLCCYNDMVENQLCCFIKHKLGKPKIKNFQELKELMSEIHGKEKHYNKIRQKSKDSDEILKKLTEKLRNIGVKVDSDNWRLLDGNLYLGEIENSREKILELAKQKGASDDEKTDLNKMMDKIFKLQRNVIYDSNITRVYSRMLFESGEYKPIYSMEELKKFGIVDNTHPLPKDYPLIENKIITSMGELLDILSLFCNNKIYLCLSFYEFSNALVKRIVGKEKLVEIIESANDKQLEELAMLEAKISKDGCSHRSMLTIFLASSHDSNKIQHVLNVVLEHESLTADVVEGYKSGDIRRNFYNNSIQISVDSFERLLNAKYKDETFSWSDHDLHELLELLKGGIKCCSEDIEENNKKINLEKIFKGVDIKKGRILLDKYYLSIFINFVFANINRLDSVEKYFKKI